MIQNGQLSREEGLRLVREFDSEFPNQYLSEVNDYLSLTTEEMVEVVDKHRNDEIWGKEDGEWRLRFPPS